MFYRQQLLRKQSDLKNILGSFKQNDSYEDIEILDDDSVQDYEFVLESQDDTQESQDKNQHICSICGKIVSTRRNLRSHLRSHNQIKRFKCNFENCDKAFRYHHHLVNHTRTHTQSSPFHCDECSASFRQKYALTLHKRKHTRDFIECKTCKSQFIMQSQLKKHEEACDGIFRPYVVKPRFKNQ
jgi:uncharacterized Zn-finger protein